MSRWSEHLTSVFDRIHSVEFAEELILRHPRGLAVEWIGDPERPLPSIPARVEGRSVAAREAPTDDHHATTLTVR